MGQTIAEKIISRCCGRKVKPGEIIRPEPDLKMIHEIPWVEFMEELAIAGCDKIVKPENILVVVDHEVPPVSPKSALRLAKTRKILRDQNVNLVYDIGRHGIEHHLAMEQGHVKPGMLILTMDGHSHNFGALGALPISVVYDFPTLLATGTTWIKVPSTIKVVINGSAGKGISPRDISSFVLNSIGSERCDYRVIEFSGSVVNSMCLDYRAVLCNIACEFGAKSTVIEPDQTALDYLQTRAKGPFQVVRNDPDAQFEAVYEFDISNLEPQVAAPETPNNIYPVSSLAGKEIQQAVIGSCASGTLQELRDTARVLVGKKVDPQVRLYITPGTQNIFTQAAEEGLIQLLLEAGAVITNPSCGTCNGVWAPLVDGETCISTTTRNDRGRMGSYFADIYLASAVTVAASALKGCIADPREYL